MEKKSGVRRFSDAPKVFTELQDDFLAPKDFYDMLEGEGVNFYVGVPDSLLKEFCSFVTDTVPPSNNIITSNEGSAVAVAAGNYLATGRIPLVYLQNSGLGNTANPLVSLAHPEVYAIPMLLIIGWRGEPGKRDEPQHRVQGRLSTNFVQSYDIPYSILPSYKEGASAILNIAFKHMRQTNSPYALLVKKNTFETYLPKKPLSEDGNYSMKREEALSLILDQLSSDDVVVGSTGFLSREIFELRKNKGSSHNSDFLTVGSMGHSSGIALGIATSKPDRQVFNLEGDGSMIMHMGTMVTVGVKKPKNYKQIVLNNGVHDSVGGQPTGAFGVDFRGIAKSSGYKETYYADTPEQLKMQVKKLRESEGPSLLEVRVNKGARSDLGRPTTSTVDSKKEFMKFLSKM
uniref:Phosphonopyruvate decarboxylase n=1 Tax=Arcella intermedia TaxID=1963864 RepID=A0A6B2L5B8_9EUKA